jgi:CRP/FNR family transcriptional regulator, cyclic AMP receptor protein
MTIQIETLKSIPYFHGISSADLNTIKNSFFEKTAERGELILAEEEISDVLYFITSGAVKLFKTSADGKEQILDIARPGQSINDVPIFDGSPNLTSAQAMGAVILYWVDKADLDRILQLYPSVAQNANKVLAAQVRRLTSLVEDLSFKPVIGRVAKILLEHSEESPDSRPKLTQQDMAAMAGTAREVVGRSLKALEQEGLIKLERHRLVISNKEALKEMVAAFS